MKCIHKCRRLWIHKCFHFDKWFCLCFSKMICVPSSNSSARIPSPNPIAPTLSICYAQVARLPARHGEFKPRIWRTGAEWRPGETGTEVSRSPGNSLSLHKKSCDSPPLSVRTQVESSGSGKAETPCRCEVGLKKDLSEGGEMPPFCLT